LPTLRRCGCPKLGASCDMPILADQPAEPVAPPRRCGVGVENCVTASDQLLRDQPTRLVGAENLVTSRDLHVLMDEAAEPVSSKRPYVRARGRDGAASRWALVE
jgi:hypothetical protein